MKEYDREIHELRRDLQALRQEVDHKQQLIQELTSAKESSKVSELIQQELEKTKEQIANFEEEIKKRHK
jgi:peptidoglycan hydrolase CwlO-like protein